MNQKILVRAWDKKNNYMFYAGSLSGVGDFYMAQYKEDTDFYERFVIDYEWMLASGFNDIAGKDIFAGDIIEFSIYSEGGETKIQDTISFSNGSFKLDKRCELLSTRMAPHHNLKVIGNTFEGIF